MDKENMIHTKKMFNQVRQMFLDNTILMNLAKQQKTRTTIRF